jgi:hypothetical protein
MTSEIIEQDRRGRGEAEPEERDQEEAVDREADDERDAQVQDRDGLAVGTAAVRPEDPIHATARKAANVTTKRTSPPPGAGSTKGRIRANGMMQATRKTKAGIGTSSWSHSSDGRSRAASRRWRVKRLKPSVTNSHE